MWEGANLSLVLLKVVLVDFLEVDVAVTREEVVVERGNDVLCGGMGLDGVGWCYA